MHNKSTYIITISSKEKPFINDVRPKTLKITDSKTVDCSANVIKKVESQKIDMESIPILVWE